MRLSAAVAVLVLVAPRGGAANARSELRGTVRLAVAGGRTEPALDAVVWIEGVRAPAARSSALPPAVASKAKRFEPHVLVVTRGTTVTFPNVDAIFHNAFSRSAGNEFDLGLYRRGASRTHTFHTPGLVHLYCNIHAEMAAYVLVLDPADAFAVADAAGSFRLPDLGAGRHRVRVWHEKAGEKDLTVEVSPDGAPAFLEVVLDAAAFRPVPHKNKFGRDYPPATQGVDRY